MYGNRKEKKSKYYKTKTEAKTAEIEFLNSIKQHKTPNDFISGADLLKEYLEYKENKVKSTTFYSITCILNKHYTEFFSKFKNINNIKASNILQWKKSLEENTSCSIDHKNRIISYFKEILTFAVENYDFDVKVVAKIHPFKNENQAQKINEAEWNYLTLDEWTIFINVVDNKYYYLIFNFLYFTGVRIGELIGLTWKNVDFKNARFKIVQQFTIKTKRGAQVIDPKTKNSIRLVDIPNKLLKLLMEHKKQEEKIYNFSSEMFVFGNVIHLSNTTLRRYLNYYLEKAGLKHITIHGFRHSHVSLLIHLGCDARDVANRVGDTVSTVERVYYHMFPKKKQETIDKLNNL